MYKDILQNIRTKDEAEKLLEEIETLEESLYKDHGSTFEEVLNKKIRNWVKVEIEKLLSSGKSNKEVLENLKNKIEDVSFLKLSIAFEPTSAGIDSFFDFVKEHAGSNVLLDITYDPAILGGAQVSYKGEYRDLSLKKKFNENYSKIEGKIKELLNDKDKQGGA